MKNTLFPIFIKSDSFRFLIIGGGKIGLEKAETLLRQNPFATLTVVGKKIGVALQGLQESYPQLVVKEKSFEANDLNEADFLIIATDNAKLNKEIKQKANEKGILVNAADQPDLCDFYLGSIVNKGYLKIAISTDGKSPVLARRLREHLEEAIPENISESIENLNAFRQQHKGDIQAKLVSLNDATKALAKKDPKKEGKKYKELTFEITVVFLAVFFGYALSTVISADELNGYIKEIPPAFYGMVLVGFFAQLVDGAVGLGYGVTCATSMMLFGIKLPAISGSIHTAEMFSSGISGFSHYKFGNVNKKLLLWLAIPGVIGAISGALLLIYLGNKYETITYAILASYTMIIGIRLVLIAFRKKIVRKKVKHTGLLGFFRWII